VAESLPLRPSRALALGLLAAVSLVHVQNATEFIYFIF
jgi:hypothetical protein